MTGPKGASPEAIIRDIKRKTRRKFTAEEKIRVVLEGLRGEASINDLCRKEGIHPTRQLNGDTIREAGSDEVNELRKENDTLKMLVADLTLDNRKLKKISEDLESGFIDT
jgi:transposase